MQKLPTAREAARVAEKFYFLFARQKGSHAIYRHGDGRRITMPIHGRKEISIGVFRQILKDIGISEE